MTMRLDPMVRDGYAVWADEHPGMIALGVWTEKRDGAGEDAEPAVLHHWPTASGVLAVCDGVGGAGVHIAGRTADGVEHTGAWTAARAVRLAVEQWFAARVLAGAGDGHRPYETGLDASIRDTLAGLRGPARSRILGTMQREFPTTLALIRYEPDRRDADAVRLDVRWAGDSRCYLLVPESGLHQLSEDDTDLPDALESMSQDPPMTNQISASRDFTVHSRRMSAGIVRPLVLLCATDGFFNYVRTPAHFEYVLVDTLLEASSAAHWGRLLVDAVTGYTQDDATLALTALGYNSFDHLKLHFQERRTHLFYEHVVPMESVDPADTEAFQQARLASWTRYRGGYERMLPVAGTEASG